MFALNDATYTTKMLVDIRSSAVCIYIYVSACFCVYVYECVEYWTGIKPDVQRFDKAHL